MNQVAPTGSIAPGRIPDFTARRASGTGRGPALATQWDEEDAPIVEAVAVPVVPHVKPPSRRAVTQWDDGPSVEDDPELGDDLGQALSGHDAGELPEVAEPEIDDEVGAHLETGAEEGGLSAAAEVAREAEEAILSASARHGASLRLVSAREDSGLWHAQEPVPGERRVTAVEHTQALLGANSIRLRGFGRSKVRPSGVPAWLQFTDKPLPAHLDASTGADKRSADANELEEQSMLARIRARTLVFWMVVLACVAFAAGAGALAWHNAARTAAREQSTLAALPAWRVDAVDATGVNVIFAGGRAERVAIGGVLPNGERLLRTDAVRGMYRTPNAATLVQASEPKPEK